MTISVDDTLLEEEEVELDVAGNPTGTQPIDKQVDARRLIERRLELKRLREQLGDPNFDYGFD
jgi:hypothetical protein